MLRQRTHRGVFSNPVRSSSILLPRAAEPLLSVLLTNRAFIRAALLSGHPIQRVCNKVRSASRLALPDNASMPGFAASYSMLNGGGLRRRMNRPA
jgi:hypothetical protein